MMSTHHWVLIAFALVAAWIFLSALDDLFIALVFLFRRKKPFAWPPESELAHALQRRIAILVPLWHEDQVIESMLRHNLASILYGNYDIFVGVYPNDPATAEAVERVMHDDARVHLAVCPHDGPTSKGDCLNWAYKAMVEYESRHGIDFEILMTHDAEDLIHPESLRLVNWFSRDYQMVQVPVLPLPTGLGEWTHGVYCDDFAEFAFKDLLVRQRLGGFLPSTGVGTGFERTALETLRQRHHGRIFDPECLTEDYENGFRMFAAGFQQLFIPVRMRGNGPVATREYFPRRRRAAVRQRSRWVAGIALQGWESHGWRVPLRQCYWFWRDRKALLGNLISPFANLMFFFWAGSCFTGHARSILEPYSHCPLWLTDLCLTSMAVSVLQAGIRVHLSARVYGPLFAAAAPLRILWGNVINFAATVQAFQQFVTARMARHSPAWRKTEHVYPGVASRATSRPRLGEILIGLESLSARDLEEALLHKAKGQRVGEYLIQVGKISVDDLDRALESQATFAPAAGD
jgi:bacteriophage N4 adsorption protein B